MEEDEDEGEYGGEDDGAVDGSLSPFNYLLLLEA